MWCSDPVEELIGEPFEGLPWLPLSDRRSLPEGPCVYFVTAAENIVYVGQTKARRERWNRTNHHLIGDLQQRDDIKIHWLGVYPRYLFGLEQCLIMVLEPEFNSSRVPGYKR